MQLPASKTLWQVILVLALIGLGLFVYFFFYTPAVPEEIQEKEKDTLITGAPVSSVYRYDAKEKEYVADAGESWQNAEFARYIYDAALEGKKLDKCYYFFYDNILKEATYGGQRRCNNALRITLGENHSCSSQGDNACTLYVYATDNAGVEGDMTAISYHIDWEKPVVSKPYFEGGKVLAQVSDTVDINYCWFYLDNENVGSMEIKDGLASLTYSISQDKSHSFFVRCADQYAAEKESYLNSASGELAEITVFENHAPEITLCRVSPAQGTFWSEFMFYVEVADQDQDALSYNWDFGDGNISTEKSPKHFYNNTGTFSPKVTVSDGEEEVSCSTAFVVVE